MTIANAIEPLPLIGFGASLFGTLNDDGYLEFEVTVTMDVQDAWVSEVSAGTSPDGWIGAWVDEE